MLPIILSVYQLKDTRIIHVQFKKCPKIIHSSVIPNFYPSSQCLYWLYWNQRAVMWRFRLAGIKSFGFSTTSHFLRRCLAEVIKARRLLILKLLPKPLSTNTCELTRAWHPKQTVAAQTGLSISPPKLTPIQFSNWAQDVLAWLISVGEHVYCQLSITRERVKMMFARSFRDGWYIAWIQMPHMKKKNALIETEM